MSTSQPAHHADSGAPSWPQLATEQARLSDLHTFQVSLARESDLDQIVALASDLLDMPIALLNLVHSDDLQVKARFGIDVDRVSREHAFCGHTVLQNDVLVVEDTVLDPRFASNPLVTDAGLRFYAGVPLTSSAGYNIGTLCVLDTAARDTLTVKQRRILTRLAELVMDKLELRRLQLADTIASQFARATTEAFLCVNAQGHISYWNDAAATLFGYEQEEALGRSLDLIVPERFRGAHAQGMGRVAAGGTSKLAGRPVELIARRRSGGEFPIELLISVWDEHGSRGMGAIIRDLSERRLQQTRLESLALTDQLTGVANRFCFTQRLELALADKSNAVAVLMFDLDGFKAVNDSLGHTAGDTLLQSITIRILAKLDTSATLARLGGDEFAILLPACGDPVQGMQIAESIIEVTREPFSIDTHLVAAGLSIGVALTGLAAHEVEDLMGAADLALYEAKAHKRGEAVLFQPHMRERSTARRNLVTDLRQAVENGEFVLHYQPQVDLRTDSLNGCEALLRWRHPKRGLLYPDAFISVLDSNELAAEVGWWTLDEACRQLKAWDAAGFVVPCIGVNLFAAQLKAPDFFERVIKPLEAYDIASSRLELELTETIALQQNDAALTPLRRLKAYGVAMAFDDFGTGFASLSTLRRFPLTRLKIDRSFVQDLTRGEEDAAIVSAVTSLGRSLGLRVIAEGIEKREHQAALLSIGCWEGQGFLFGRGIDGQAFQQTYAGAAATQHLASSM